LDLTRPEEVEASGSVSAGGPGFRGPRSHRRRTTGTLTADKPTFIIIYSCVGDVVGTNS
jgi:hypothetical protein